VQVSIAGTPRRHFKAAPARGDHHRPATSVAIALPREQAIEDTRVLKAQIRAAEEEANRYADAIGNASASGPAVARLMGRSATAENRKMTLGERLAQVELQR
jgi:hypothetical protein